MTTTYKVQTVNGGNPEVIQVINGIAREVIAGHKNSITMQQAKAIAQDLNKKVKIH